MKKSTIFILVYFLLFSSYIKAQESTCYGTTKNGRLDKGVKLPSDGKNFTSYGNIPELVGRTYVHSKVKKVVVESYKNLETSYPEKIFKYAETGLDLGDSDNLIT